MEPEATGPLCPCSSCQTTVSRPGALQMAHRDLGQLGEHRKEKGKGASSQEGVCGMWSLCLCVYNGKAGAPDTLNINDGGNAKTCAQSCSLSAASSHRWLPSIYLHTWEEGSSFAFGTAQFCLGVWKRL